MSDEFAAHTGISWQGNVGTVQYGGGDQNMLVLFYNRPMHNPAKSADAGRPIHEDKIYVRIQVPGERLNVVDRPATAQDQRRFPMQWAQFKEQRQQVPEGTPIEMLYSDQPSIAANLKACGVHTIEQCAALSGHAIESIGMGAQQYANDAAKYIELSNKGVKASQLKHELEDRDRQIHTLTHKVEMLMAEVERLREGATANIDLAQIQRLLAGQQQRPEFPAASNIDKGFDAQTSIINANHPTADIARQRQPKRTRARIGE